MWCLATLLLVAIPLVSACDQRCQFEDFKVKFGRSYPSPQEEDRRFDIFKERLAEADKLNKENPLAHFGVTQFSDLTKEEFRSRYVNYNRNATATTAQELPDRDLNLRATLATTYKSPYTSAVLNQGNCGSCWAFAAAGVASSAWYKARGTLKQFAPQQLVDCDKVDGGCDGGWPIEAAKYLVSKGAMLNSAYAYTSGNTGKRGSCKYSSSSVVGKFSSYFSRTWGESTMDAVVAKYGPVIVTINADTLDYYTSGILTTTSGCTKLGYPDHAVALVGWGVSNGVKYWLIQNSWGTGWGESGFFRVKRGVNTCLLTTDAAIGLISPTARVKEADAAVAEATSEESTYEVSLEENSCVPNIDACGSRTCGTAHDGCGGIAMCGLCDSGMACLASGECQKSVACSTTMSTVSSKSGGAFAWSEGSGSGNSYDNKTSVSTSSTLTADSGTHFLKWDGSSSMTTNGASTFTAFVNASADGGHVGIGCRMGQKRKDDGIWMSAEPLGNGTATVRVHQSFGGATSNQTIMNITWNDGEENNMTLECISSDNSSVIHVRLWVNNATHDRPCAINASGFPNPGAMFIAASGANKTFSDMGMQTHEDLDLSTLNCVSAGTLAAQFARAAGVLPSSLSVNVTPSASCAGACENDSTACGKSSRVSIADSTHVTRYGYVVGTAAELQQLASHVSLHAQSLIAEGALDSVGIQVASVSVVPAALAADAIAIALPAAGSAATSAVLSTGAIVGIAVGGAAAVAIVGGAATAAVVVAKRGSGKEAAAAESTGEEVRKQAPVRGTLANFLAKGNGVDVMNATADHSSITGRAPPVEMSS